VVQRGGEEGKDKRGKTALSAMVSTQSGWQARFRRPEVTAAGWGDRRRKGGRKPGKKSERKSLRREAQNAKMREGPNTSEFQDKRRSGRSGKGEKNRGGGRGLGLTPPEHDLGRITAGDAEVEHVPVQSNGGGLKAVSGNDIRSR